jgi:hypothetical protein
VPGKELLMAGYCSPGEREELVWGMSINEEEKLSHFLKKGTKTGKNL